jgi:hypothetical protein
MTHLDIRNTSYGQKKGQESNWQFDSRPLKVGIRPISLCLGDVQHIVESSQRGLQLFFKPHFNRRSIEKVMGPQSRGSPNFGNFGTPTWESQTKCHLDAGPVANNKIYYKGEGGGFPPKVRAMVSLVNSSLFVACLNTKSVLVMH